ncbi:hypothetical protein [Enterovirga sp.]|jgi:hypothetical protein|uniref:hypothetical protein n=1 Tax=Enterovirga sp. TaxID=2026350 RepID=UPI0026313CE7|nr:hypothetical protein [Enterovirga sp.]MDB5591234.1 hypothetical protein [Enterovirga sp.]
MRRTLVLLATAILGASAAAAYEVVPAEKRVIPYVAELPLCGDPSVLAEISTRFAEKEAQFWNSALTIVEYSRIKPLAWRPWGLDTIPRRFCTATALVSSGRRHRIDYSVREDLNFISAGWGVEWCVTGLDRNLAYAPACRMARP